MRASGEGGPGGSAPSEGLAGAFTAAHAERGSRSAPSPASVPAQPVLAGEGEGPRTLARLAIVAAVLAAYGLSRLVFNALGLRVLGAETVGTINIALSMAVLVSLPVSAGTAPALSRFFPLLETESARASLRRWILGIGAAWMAVPAALFLLVYGLGLGFPYGVPFAPIVLLWSMLYGLYSLCRAELFAGGTPASALWIEMAGVACFAAALLVLFATGRGVWAPFSVYYLPAVAWVAWRVSRGPGTDPEAGGSAAPSRPEVRWFAWYSLLGSAAGLGISYLTTIVVSASLDLARAGLWATLISVAAPILLAPRTLNASFFPRLSLLGSTNPEAFRRLCRLHQQFSSLLALGAVGGALVLTGPILALVLGGATHGAAPQEGLAVSWILIALACYGLFRGEPIITACAALGRARLTATAAFAGACVCAALWAVLLPRAGMPGVGTGYASYALLTPVLVWAVSRRRGPAPPVFVFAADVVFVAVAALVVTGLTRDILGQIAGLTLIVVTLAWGLVTVRKMT